MELHGFFYTDRDGKLYGLKAPRSVRKVMDTTVSAGLALISPEKYWLSYAPFMMHHAPQGYLGWGGKSYWAVLLPAKDEKHKFVKDSMGVHLLEFSAEKNIRYAYLKATPERLPQGLHDLVYVPWDWLLDGEGDDDAFELPQDICAMIRTNVAFSTEIHEQYQKTMPPEKYWEGFGNV